MTLKDLVWRNGIYYKKFSEIPFTGEVTPNYDRNGDRYKGFLKNGKKEGLWLNYWRNGQIYTKGEYKDGKK